MDGGEATAAQRAADEQLTAAVEAARRAYWPEATQRVLTDYVVVFGESFLDSEGQPADATGHLVRDNYVPAYRMRGLLLQALLSRGEPDEA